MSTEANKALAQRFVEAVNAGHLEWLDEVYDADYVHHDANLPPDVQRGRENWKRGFAPFYVAFPDLHATPDDRIAEGDRVATRLSWRGTHKGDLMGIPASGRAVNFSMIYIQRVANGKIVEGWVNFDAMGMMQQIGAIPTPG